jgi:hypothetical protein
VAAVAGGGQGGEEEGNQTGFASGFYLLKYKSKLIFIIVSTGIVPNQTRTIE